MLGGKFVVLLGKRRLLNFKLHDAAGNFVELRGHGIHFRANHRARFIHKVDCLIRQEAVRNIAVGKRSRSDECVVVDLHAVVYLIAFLQAAQNGNGVLHRRFIHHHRLEAAGKRGVLFDVFAVFVERRCADAVQLAAREHRFEQVACIHRAFRPPCADNVVQLVDEQDDTPFGALHLAQHGLQALFKLTAELRARNERAHVQGKDLAFLKRRRNIPAHDALRKPLRDGRFAHARLADKNRVVLCFARKNPDDVPHFVIPADHGVKLLLARKLHKVLRIFAERIIGTLRRIARDPRAAADIVERRKKCVALYGKLLEDGLDRFVRRVHNSKEHMLHGNILILHVLRLLFGGVKRTVQLRRNVNPVRFPAASRYLRAALHCGAHGLRERIRIFAHARKQACN